MTGTVDSEKRWPPSDRSQAYRELDHPADVFLEVYGRDVPDLFENALFALYDQLAELEEFEVVSKRTIQARGASVAEALRNLLSEALYLFESESFVAMKASVAATGTPDGKVEVTAELGGEKIDRERHRMSAEVKAVTYHQLTAEQLPEGGWRATVLFDV
jgi:SHS2 domain-containing protein